jgi:hypothetical protein
MPVYRNIFRYEALRKHLSAFVDIEFRASMGGDRRILRKNSIRSRLNISFDATWHEQERNGIIQ